MPAQQDCSADARTMTSGTPAGKTGTGSHLLRCGAAIVG